jgi:hypothetical protein
VKHREKSELMKTVWKVGLEKPNDGLFLGCLLERTFRTEKGIWEGKTVKCYFGLL